jgi:hypothetical protein
VLGGTGLSSDALVPVRREPNGRVMVC